MAAKLQYQSGSSEATRDAALQRKIRRVLILVCTIPAAIVVTLFFLIAYANVETVTFVVINKSSSTVEDAGLDCRFGSQTLLVGAVPIGQTREKKFGYRTDSPPDAFTYRRAGQTQRCELDSHTAANGNVYTVTVTDRDVSISCQGRGGSTSTIVRSPTTQ
jgi:hypothetical protein